jgi:hypothetical protein
MTLLTRLMWPKTGEDIEVYRNGSLIAAGYVNYVDDHVVSITGRSLAMSRLTCSDLLRGLEDRTIVIKRTGQ